MYIMVCEKFSIGAYFNYYHCHTINIMIFIIIVIAFSTYFFSCIITDIVVLNNTLSSYSVSKTWGSVYLVSVSISKEPITVTVYMEVYYSLYMFVWQT